MLLRTTMDMEKWRLRKLDRVKGNNNTANARGNRSF